MHACSVKYDSCNPMDCSPPGSSVHGIFQARNGLPFPILKDLPEPGIKPEYSMSPALASGFFTTEPPAKPAMSSKPNNQPQVEQW